MLTILNFFLTLIALLLFFTVILLFAVVVVMKQQVALSTPKDMPCLFEWGEWSSCSSTCRISQEDATPSMRRRVTRVYHASGKYARCPEGLKVGFEQIAPCNTQLCPQKLSDFGWSECFYYIPHIGRASGCYRIRDLTKSDALIEIDREDLIRNCSIDECPEFMT
ncbi:unnamed protein product [Toxocara canis]|uniref:TSP1_CCN domain-containing protein n=1 Tax=Toxocara canis TaxID=6265 RepID=A0A183VFH3_TOXCA|nr:unnamed protein product [Toxocara canis]